jgi:hypothetical protein
MLWFCAANFASQFRAQAILGAGIETPKADRRPSVASMYSYAIPTNATQYLQKRTISLDSSVALILRRMVVAQHFRH